MFSVPQNIVPLRCCGPDKRFCTWETVSSGLQDRCAAYAGSLLEQEAAEDS